MSSIDLKTGRPSGSGKSTFIAETEEMRKPGIRSGSMLLILPVLFGILWIYCYSQSKTFFSTYPDSIYIYLVNATNIASGNLAIGHYDNPGTPVHLLGGLIIYIVHLFAGHNRVYEDVMADPEFYLRFCAGTFGLLLLAMVYFGSRFILKHTGNIVLALFFQLLPVCSFFTVHYLLLVRMCPENLIIAVLIFYYAFLWVLCYKRDLFPDSTISKKSHLLLFSFISALLVTTKMTCLPFLALPLFFLRTFPQKAGYVVLTAILGALMIYPIWPKLPEMYDWFTRLATHSGEYGQGKEGVSADTLFSNLGKLFCYDLFFTTGYFLLAAILIAGVIKKKWNESFYRLILAFFIICTVQLALASKQFGYHYLIASQMSIIPCIAGAYRLMNGRKTSPLPGRILLAVAILWFGFKTAQSVMLYRGSNKIYETSVFAKKYAHVPKIITTGYQGSCFIESGIRFGASYGGPAYYPTNYFLRKLYPDSYFYDMQLPENTIKKWDVVLTPTEFFQDKPEVLVYFIRMSKDEELRVIGKITGGLEPIVKSIREEKIIEETGEHFYMIEIDTAKARPRYVSQINTHYDFETTNAEHTSFASSDQKSAIGDVAALSTDHAVSGKSSVMLRPGEYSCCTSFDVQPGDAFDITVKYNSPDRPLGITLSGEHPEFFDRNCEAIDEDYGNGWKQVRLKAIVPIDCPEKKLNFCLFYFGKKVCFADDLDIRWSKGSEVRIPKAPAEFTDIKKFILKAEGGNYISLSPNQSLVADQSDASKAEVFEKVILPDGRTALKSAKGKYVCVDGQDHSRLVASGVMAKEWESFRFEGESLAAVNIISVTGMYVCANHADKDQLIADRPKASTWETFEIIKK